MIKDINQLILFVKIAIHIKNTKNKLSKQEVSYLKKVDSIVKIISKSYQNLFLTTKNSSEIKEIKLLEEKIISNLKENNKFLIENLHNMGINKVDEKKLPKLNKDFILNQILNAELNRKSIQETKSKVIIDMNKDILDVKEERLKYRNFLQNTVLGIVETFPDVIKLIDKLNKDTDLIKEKETSGLLMEEDFENYLRQQHSELENVILDKNGIINIKEEMMINDFIKNLESMFPDGIRNDFIPNILESFKTNKNKTYKKKIHLETNIIESTFKEMGLLDGYYIERFNIIKENSKLNQEGEITNKEGILELFKLYQEIFENKDELDLDDLEGIYSFNDILNVDNTKKEIDTDEDINSIEELNKIKTYNNLVNNNISLTLEEKIFNIKPIDSKILFKESMEKNLRIKRVLGYFDKLDEKIED